MARELGRTLDLSAVLRGTRRGTSGYEGKAEALMARLEALGLVPIPSVFR
jgi:hypothetical protein